GTMNAISDSKMEVSSADQYPRIGLLTTSRNSRIAYLRPENRPLFGCSSAILRAEFRHLPSAYDVIAAPNASYQSAFILRPIGASALARNDPTLLAKSNPPPHRGGGALAAGQQDGPTTWAAGEAKLVREE